MERVSSKSDSEKDSLLIKPVPTANLPESASSSSSKRITTSSSSLPSLISSDSPILKPMNQLLSSLSQKRQANKPKYGNFSSNVQQKIRSTCSTRCFLLSVGAFVMISIAVYYWEFISNGSVSSFFPASPFNLGDRSSTYNVKILPALLSEEELNSLPKESFSYLAMIDAGSSGCRAHIYRYGKLGALDGPLYLLPQHKSKKITPGLSTFASHPEDAGPYITGLIDFMKEQVPEADWSVTPIWLKATAGMRLLPSSQSEAILDSVRRYLLNSKNSPFYFRSSYARIIPGTEEGGFGWIAFNYLKKVIGPKRPKTSPPHAPYAVIEMGGASAQVSQLAPSVEEANKIPKEFRFSFDIEGEEFHLYTHSYLGYGAEQAMAQFDRLLKGKSSSSSDSSSFSPLAVAAAVKDPCKHEGFLSYRKARRQLTYTRALEEVAGNISMKAAVASSSSADADNTSTAAAAVGPKRSGSGGSSLKPSCVQSVASLFTTITSFGSSLLNAASQAVASVSSTNLCTTEGPHSFACVYQPNFVVSSQNILAFENFYYMSSALGVKPARQSRKLLGNESSSFPAAAAAVATTFPLETTPEHIREASETFCSLPWSEVQANYPKDAQAKAVNMKTCFLSAFSYSFLVDGLKIPSSKVITIQKEVESSEIEWALGAAYKETSDFLKRAHLRAT